MQKLKQDNSSTITKVSICIATYRRPLLLQKLIGSLENLNIPEGVAVEIIVVDNDSARTAEPVCREYVKTLKVPFSYFVESRQNISLARNLAIANATGKWIAFIDDDERVDNSWLYWLIHTQKETNADGVFGPVLPVFQKSAPSWIISSKFFDRPRKKTGYILKQDFRSGNVLVRAALLKKTPFDPRFGLTGGEDSDLFSRLFRKGAKFVWCDEALVYETIIPERLTLSGLMFKDYKGGFVDTILQKNTNNSWTANVYIFVKAIVVTVICICLFPISWIKGRNGFLWVLRKLMLQFGHIYAVFNNQYQYYAPIKYAQK
ncbi:MAG: glycosyltransferase family 2 protein [bacterium]